MAKPGTLTASQAGEDVEQQGLSSTIHMAAGVQDGSVIWGSYPDGLKRHIHTYTTQVFIAAVFITAKLEASKRPSVGGWIHQRWCIQTTERDSVLERNELAIHEDVEE